MEYLDIVNENNKVIGKTTKKEIYDRKLPHRIVHIIVVNPETSKIYLQKRSDTVSFLPGYYSTSAGGHVRSGESYEEAAKRELKEELGLEIPIFKLKDLKFLSDNHIRLIELFIAYTKEGFNFRDGEVESGDFVDMETLSEMIKEGQKIHPQLKLCFEWLCENKDIWMNKINV